MNNLLEMWKFRLEIALAMRSFAIEICQSFNWQNSSEKFQLVWKSFGCFACGKSLQKIQLKFGLFRGFYQNVMIAMSFEVELYLMEISDEKRTKKESDGKLVDLT